MTDLISIDIDLDDGDLTLEINGVVTDDCLQLNLERQAGLHALRTAKILAVKNYKVSCINEVTGVSVVIQERKKTDIEAGQYFLDYCKEAADLIESGARDRVSFGGNCTLDVFAYKQKVKKKLLNR